MSECASLAPMTKMDAVKCCIEIRNNLGSVRSRLLELHNREGWRALGYKSWRECVQQEFGGSQSRMYQELAAAQVEVNISHLVEIPESSQPAKPIPERHARPLASLPPEKQAAVYKRAIDSSGGKPTAADVEREAAAERQEMTVEEIEKLGAKEQLKIFQENKQRINEEDAEDVRNEAAEARAKRIDRWLFYLGKAEDMGQSLGEEGKEALALVAKAITVVQRLNTETEANDS